MDELEQKWRDVIGDWRGSGLSKKQYCVERGERLHQLRYWLAKLEPAGKKSNPVTTNKISKFVELKSGSEPAPMNKIVELELGKGLVLRILG